MDAENPVTDVDPAEVEAPTDLHPALLVFSSRLAADASRKAPNAMLFGVAGLGMALLALPAKHRWLPAAAAAATGLGVYLAQRLR